MDAEPKLKTFFVALLALAISVGFAEAERTRHVLHQTKHAHRHKATATTHVQKNAIPMCAEAQQVTSASVLAGTPSDS